MKIAIISPYFPPYDLNGSEIAASILATKLSKNGFNVHVITSWDEGLSKFSIVDGVCIHRIKRVNFPLIKEFSFLLGFLLQIKLAKPDIIHVQGITPDIICCLFAKFFWQIPYIVYGRGSDVYFPNIIFKLSLMKMIVKYSDYTLVLTNHMKNALEQVVKREIIVIPNGIETSQFNKVTKEQAKKKLNVDNFFVITFIGTIRKIKGVKYLIEALDLLILNQYFETRLLLIGEIEDQEITDLIKNRKLASYIILVGKVEQEAISLYLNATDVFVLPSISEGFPNVLLEAMASDLPIIATSVSGIPEIIHDGTNGFLVNAESSHEIFSKLIYCIDHPEIMKIISDINRANSKIYEWDKIVEQLIKIYNKIGIKD